MKQVLLVLVVIVASCQSHVGKRYRYNVNGMVGYEYQFSKDSFLKTSVFELEQVKESGTIIKKGHQFQLIGEDVIDTIFIYRFFKSHELGQKYYMDCSNIAVSKCNEEGRSLKGKTSFKVNDKPLNKSSDDSQNGPVMKFENPLVKIETRDSAGNVRYDFIQLVQGYVLKFKKLQVNDVLDDRFKLSRNGSKIKVYSKFIGTGDQESSEHKRKKKVYKRIEE